MLEQISLSMQETIKIIWTCDHCGVEQIDTFADYHDFGLVCHCCAINYVTVPFPKVEAPSRDLVDDDLGRLVTVQKLLLQTRKEAWTDEQFESVLVFAKTNRQRLSILRAVDEITRIFDGFPDWLYPVALEGTKELFNETTNL